MQQKRHEAWSFRFKGWQRQKEMLEDPSATRKGRRNDGAWKKGKKGSLSSSLEEILAR